jgi:hypothetical protein
VKTFGPPFVSFSRNEYCHRVFYVTEADYRAHFIREYCFSPVLTFDAIPVTFLPSNFDHAFYKYGFSWPRAQRIDWIREVLQDPQADLHVGFDTYTYRYMDDRRVSMVNDSYVVVIALAAPNDAYFVTAYIADGATPWNIRNSPLWSNSRVAR